MGTLYLIATPVGNLADMSIRSVETLQSVSLIACEDTRTSSHLLKHYEIQQPKCSFHQHNEHRVTETLMQHLDRGEDVALISDAGTPGISDPGFLAARAAHQRGHRVCALPGASAALVALSASGLPCDRFLFEGFLPVKKGRKRRLDEITAMDHTVILFESVHRIERLLDELSERCDSERLAAVCRELTKKFEEVIRGTIPRVTSRIRNHEALKGEFVVILAGRHYRE